MARGRSRSPQTTGRNGGGPKGPNAGKRKGSRPGERPERPARAKREPRAERAGERSGAPALPAAAPEPSPVRLVLPMPLGARPRLAAPRMLTVAPDADYALLDSGAGEKIERYGPLTVRRPENQAIWPRRLGEAAWEDVDAVFTGDTDEEGTGRWRFPKEPLGETWPLAFDGLPYHGRFTSFRHTGVFPEQAAHWRFLEAAIRGANRPIRCLNLFGYTGLASLVAARAGAEVTHVDASKKAIGWARENQALAELDDRPIRWICEDAVRYGEREVKRGSAYEAILLDPPKFGRGPKGEVWQIFEDLPYLLALVRALLSDRPLTVILTAYSIRASFHSLANLMAEHFRGAGGAIEAGELLITEEGEDARVLSTSLFARWTA